MSKSKKITNPFITWTWPLFLYFILSKTCVLNILAFIISFYKSAFLTRQRIFFKKGIMWPSMTCEERLNKIKNKIKIIIIASTQIFVKINCKLKCQKDFSILVVSYYIQCPLKRWLLCSSIQKTYLFIMVEYISILIKIVS